MKALADATKNLKKSKAKLNKITNLKKQGRASQKAVDLAITQLTLANSRSCNCNNKFSNGCKKFISCSFIITWNRNV